MLYSYLRGFCLGKCSSKTENTRKPEHVVQKVLVGHNMVQWPFNIQNKLMQIEASSEIRAKGSRKITYGCEDQERLCSQV
jgi:hypothetical protein